jgi:hypothetical protein
MPEAGQHLSHGYDLLWNETTWREICRKVIGDGVVHVLSSRVTPTVISPGIVRPAQEHVCPDLSNAVLIAKLPLVLTTGKPPKVTSSILITVYSQASFTQT